MPLEPLLDEIGRALENEESASRRERPVIVMFATNVIFDCQTVSYQGANLDELRVAAPATPVE